MDYSNPWEGATLKEWGTRTNRRVPEPLTLCQVIWGETFQRFLWNWTSIYYRSKWSWKTYRFLLLHYVTLLYSLIPALKDHYPSEILVSDPYHKKKQTKTIEMRPGNRHLDGDYDIGPLWCQQSSTANNECTHDNIWCVEIPQLLWFQLVVDWAITQM